MGIPLAERLGRIMAPRDVTLQRPDISSSLQPEHQEPNLNSLVADVVNHRGWLSREQFLDQLSPQDRSNVLLVMDFIKQLPFLSEKFASGDASIFAVGPAALPVDVLECFNSNIWEKYVVHPQDIDLRVVVGGEKIDGKMIHQGAREMWPTSELRGIIKSVDTGQGDYPSFIALNSMRLMPKASDAKSINVLFPGALPMGEVVEAHTNTKKFLDLQEEKLYDLPSRLRELPPTQVEDPFAVLELRRLVQEGFVVRLV